MNRKFKLSAIAVVSALACGTASAATGTLTVDATLTSACEVNTGGAIHFGSFDALASSGTRTANSGSTFQVACSASVAAPTIFSATTREMGNGTDVIPFSLSLASGGDDLAIVSTGDAFTITQNGTMQDVTLYGEILAADYQANSSGVYTVDLTMTVEY